MTHRTTFALSTVCRHVPALVLVVLTASGCTAAPNTHYLHQTPDSVDMAPAEAAKELCRQVERTKSRSLSDVRVERHALAFTCHDCSQQEHRIELLQIAGMEVHQPGYQITLVRHNGSKLFQFTLHDQNHVQQMIRTIARLREHAAEVTRRTHVPMEIQHTRRMGVVQSPTVTTGVTQYGSAPTDDEPAPLKGNFGVFAGVAASSLKLDFEAAQQTVFGPTVGVGMHYGGRLPIQLDARALVIRKGAIVIGGGPGGRDHEQSMWYVEVPIMARLELARRAPVHPFIYGGGALSLLISGESTNPTQDYLFNVGYNTEFSGTIGAGLSIRLDNGQSIELDVRQTWGLTEILPGAHNSTLALTVGYSR